MKRIFWLEPEPQTLWNALELDQTDGRMTLEQFAYYFGTKEEDLSNSQKWSVAHKNMETPAQDFSASFHHLKAAQRRNPSRREDISQNDVKSMSCNETISAVLLMLESTELRARDLFRELDAGSDRHLDVDELQGALNVLGLPLTRDQTRSVINIFDRDGDRQLKYSEFIRLMAFVQNQRDIEKNEVETNSSNNPTLYEESEVNHKPTTVRDAARCSKARKQREEIAKEIGVDKIDPLDYKRLEMVSNGIYNSKRKVRTLFKLMDVNGSKNIDGNELYQGLQECNVDVSLDECNALVEYFSKGSGSLKYSQFMKMLAASSKK